MKKTHKLAVLLLLCLVILLFLWLRADRPCLAEQNVLNRLERANLAEESRLLNTQFAILAGYNGSLQYEEHLAAGITDTHLHMTRLWKRSFLWYPPKGRTTPRVYAWPLEETVIGVAPVQAANVCFFCYTALPAAQYQARLTVGETTLTTSGLCEAGGFTLFEFADTGAAARADGQLPESIYENLTARLYDLMDIGYDPGTKSADLTLEVTLLDAQGEMLTTARWGSPSE